MHTIANKLSLTLASMFVASTFIACSGSGTSGPPTEAQIQEQKKKTNEAEITRLKEQIKNEAGIAVTVDDYDLEEFSENILLALKEFQAARHGRKADTSAYKEIQFTNTFYAGTAVTEASDDPSILIVQLDRTPEAIRHSFKFLPNEVDALDAANAKAARTLVEKYGLEIDFFGSDRDGSENWALELLLRYASESDAKAATVRSLGKVILVSSVQVGRKTFMMDARSMDESATRQVLASVDGIHRQISDLDAQAEAINRKFGINIKIDSTAYFDLVGSALARLEEEASRQDHGLRRLREIEVGNRNYLYFWPAGKDMVLNVTGKKEDEVTFERNLVRLRANAPIACEAKGVSCAK